MNDEPTAYQIEHGLDLKFIRALPDDDRLTLARLLARASERSYRRGFQQGASIASHRPEDLPRNLAEWRYGCETDISPWPDAARAETSLSRLHTENSGLRALGLPTSKINDGREIFVWPPKSVPEE